METTTAENRITALINQWVIIPQTPWGKCRNMTAEQYIKRFKTIEISESWLHDHGFFGYWDNDDHRLETHLRGDLGDLRLDGLSDVEITITNLGCFRSTCYCRIYKGTECETTSIKTAFDYICLMLNAGFENYVIKVMNYDD